MTLSRKIIVRKRTLQTTNNFLYYKSRGQVVWQGSYLICFWNVKKVLGWAVFLLVLQTMNCVIYNKRIALCMTCLFVISIASYTTQKSKKHCLYSIFLVNKILRKNRGGKRFENSYVSGLGGGKKLPKSSLRN